MKESKVSMKASLGKIKPDLDQLARRAPVYLGKKCNARCVFCYYKEELDTATHLDVKEVFSQLDFLKEYGIEDVEFTGGEPTTHPHWFDILAYASENFRQVACVTNGIKFADNLFLVNSQRSGLKEILFSLHGYNEKTHEEITQVPGSFFKIKTAISRAKTLGILVRINSTVCSLNYKELEDGTGMINAINPVSVNYLPINFWNRGIEATAITYKEMAPEIKKAILKLNAKNINVRYIPYCYMEGFEKNVCNWYQHPFDHWDWNVELGSDMTTSEEKRKELLSQKYGINSLKKADKVREKSYAKDKKCITCRFFYICDGIEKELTEAVPVLPKEGNYILNPLHFRENYCNINEYSEVLNDTTSRGDGS